MVVVLLHLMANTRRTVLGIAAVTAGQLGPAAAALVEEAVRVCGCKLNAGAKS